MSDIETLKPLIEALVYASDSPLTLERLSGVLEHESKADIKAALNSLIVDYRKRSGGIFIEEVAGGYSLRTNQEAAPWIRRLHKIGLQKISKASMESLAIIAYKQPVTRGELEAVRGVDSGGVLSTLMEKRFIKIVGRKEIPGRPVVYGTTKEFLETFDLGDLSCLPPLKDIQKTEETDAAQARVQAQGELAQGQQAGLFTGVETEAKADDGQAQAPDREAPEDNSRRRDNVEEEGRRVDSSGPGNGEPADDSGVGGKG